MRKSQAACACAGVADNSRPHKRSAQRRLSPQEPTPGRGARPAARPGFPALPRPRRRLAARPVGDALGVARRGLRALPSREPVGSFGGEQDLGGKKKSQRNLFATVQNGGICTSFWWRQWPRPGSRELPWVSAVAAAGGGERDLSAPSAPGPALGPLGCPRPPHPQPASPQPRASSL